jgi:2-polyprenyl-3-methyl-5-hydroxy-6-metoxy-1,4-benzoquinol methylase
MIRIEARDRCLVCGNEGIVLHGDVPDLLLGTPGRWRIVRCRTDHCRMLWLNPRPVAEDLASLYEGYLTHEARPPDDRRAGLRDQVRRAMHQRLLGYPADVDAQVRVLASLVSFVPWYRTAAMRDLFWLPAGNIGRLLDIGCGNGGSMQRFVSAGWAAIGIDFDAAAVAAARSVGLDARVGALKEHAFQDAQFDVVLMSHVIEHLADPIDELKECRRILKPTGCIVIATPNAQGLGHHAFGRHWLGLDPPRHLQIFTAWALTRMLALAGFRPVQVRAHAGVAASWMVASQWRREAEATGGLAALPDADTPVPARWLALARLQAIGVACGAQWGDELVGRYAVA